MTGSLFNKFKEDKVKVLLGEGHMARQCTQSKRPRNSTWFMEKMLLVQAQEASQELDEEQLAFLADPRILDDKEITSDSNINSYEQYLQQTQNTIVQDTNSSTQQDAMILSVIEQMSNQVTNYNKTNLENKRVNESLTAELERYKERVKTFEQRFNVDLNSHEKLIDSQMVDMIWDRNALKQEIDSLKQTLSKHLNKKESL
ncbi:hypothetical protein Tco_1109517 [Tanacetum coccineum]